MPTASFDRRLIVAAMAALPLAPAPAAARGAPSIIIDDADWPQLSAWARGLRLQVAAWWPRINAALGAPAPAIPLIRIQLATVEPASVPAATDGAHIVLNAPYVLANLGAADMVRMVAHELTHVAQAYPAGTGPGWLVEGIADYVRYYVLFPDDPGRAFDPAAVDWRTGYAPAAGLLDWALRRRPKALAAANAAMRRGRDGEQALVAAAGASPRALWDTYLASRPAAASIEARRTYLQGLKPAPAG